MSDEVKLTQTSEEGWTISGAADETDAMRQSFWLLPDALLRTATERGARVVAHQDGRYLIRVSPPRKH